LGVRYGAAKTSGGSQYSIEADVPVYCNLPHLLLEMFASVNAVSKINVDHVATLQTSPTDFERARSEILDVAAEWSFSPASNMGYRKDPRTDQTDA
jgi:hypothetical protein